MRCCVRFLGAAGAEGAGTGAGAAGEEGTSDELLFSGLEAPGFSWDGVPFLLGALLRIWDGI